MQPAESLLDRVDWPPSGHYVLAVSGGVDSVALLHMMANHPAGPWRLQIAHFDHGLRDDSALDRRLVQDLAAIFGLPFHFGEGKLGQASEETARDARYAFLRRMMEEQGADGIITAHHRDDRLETSVFNALRGTGRSGLAPMKRMDGVYRPLMKINKTELESYARHHGLPWREDGSNRDLRYDRNFIRHELLPTARRHVDDFDGRYHGALNELDGLNQRIDQEFLRTLREHGEVTADMVRLPRELLIQMRPATLEQFLAFLLRHLQLDIPASQQLIGRLAYLVRTGQPGSRMHLSSNFEVRVGYQDITVCRSGQVAGSLTAQDLLLHTSVRFGRHQLSYGPLEPASTGSIHLPPLVLKVRRPRPGDRIAPLGLAGSKKLQDLFTDAKIDREERQRWPVVENYEDGAIVWVPGLAVSRVHLTANGYKETYCLAHEVV